LLVQVELFGLKLSGVLKIFRDGERTVLRYAALLMKQAVGAKADSQLEGRESQK
jgi:hypothetical protein